MPRAAAAEWLPVGIDQLEPAAWKALQHAGSACVVAGPGAGKSEFLAQRADYLFSSGACGASRRVLAISFKRDAARNLADRVRRRTPEAADRFDSMTFDAFTKMLVDRFRAALPTDWRIRGEYEIWFPHRDEPASFLSDLMAANPDRRSEIAGLPRMNFVREVIGQHELPESIGDARSVEELAALSWWDRHYQAPDPQRVDFVMLNRLAELLVRSNGQLHRAMMATYPFVFVDEFQDTTFAQYAFLGSIFGRGRTVVTAVGDDKQRIMGWAGALGDAFEEFRADFDAERFELRWNFRSSAPLTALHQVVAQSLDPEAASAVSKVPVSVAGEPLELWHFESAASEARYIARWIKADSDATGLSPDRYALLARQKTADFEPRFAEELERVGLSIRNDDGLVGALRLQDLLADDLCELVLAILRLAATNGGNAKEWTSASVAVSRMHTQEHDADWASQSDDALSIFLHRLRRWLRRNPPGDQAADRVISTIVSYLGEHAIRAAFPSHRQAGSSERVVAALKNRMLDVAEAGSTWIEVCDAAEGRGAVPLMTVHKSKGLEYHTVFFLSLDDNQWWAHRNDPRESTCTFFVGLSRAEQRTIFTYCQARGGRLGIGSLYEMLESGNVSEIWPTGEQQGVAYD